MTSPQLKQYHERRATYVALLGGKCANCESRDNLEFDHVDPSQKSFDISERLTSSFEVIEQELKKCQLLCRKCHKAKSEIDNGKAEHGKYSMYRHHKCRCELCKAANSKQQQEHRKRKLARGEMGTQPALTRL